MVRGTVRVGTNVLNDCPAVNKAPVCKTLPLNVINIEILRPQHFIAVCELTTIHTFCLVARVHASNGTLKRILKLLTKINFYSIDHNLRNISSLHLHEDCTIR